MFAVLASFCALHVHKKELRSSLFVPVNMRGCMCIFNFRCCFWCQAPVNSDFSKHQSHQSPATAQSCLDNNHAIQHLQMPNSHCPRYSHRPESVRSAVESFRRSFFPTYDLFLLPVILWGEQSLLLISFVQKNYGSFAMTLMRLKISLK